MGGRVVVEAESVCSYLVVLDADREMLLKFIVSCVLRPASGSRSNPWVAKSIKNALIFFVLTVDVMVWSIFDMLLRIFIHISGDDAFTHFMVNAFVYFMAACLLIRVHVSFMSGLMIFVAVVIPECIYSYVALASRHLHERVWRESSVLRAAF